MSIKLKLAGRRHVSPNSDLSEPVNVGFSGNRIFTDGIKSHWVGVCCYPVTSGLVRRKSGDTHTECRGPREFGPRLL